MLSKYVSFCCFDKGKMLLSSWLSHSDFSVLSKHMLLCQENVVFVTLAVY